MPRGKKGTGKQPVAAGLIRRETHPCDDCGVPQTVDIDVMGMLPAILCPDCLAVRVSAVKVSGQASPARQRGRPPTHRKGE